MNLWSLILRNIATRRLASALTALSVALGAMLVTSILLLRAELETHYLEPGKGYSLVVGAPGSGLQLVLNAISHIDRSPGLMPWPVYEEIADHPSTRLAVPYAVGDAFRGYRVVATTEAFFDPRFPHPESKNTAGKFADGGPFTVDPQSLKEALEAMVEGKHDAHEGHDHDHDHRSEAVVGSEVAARLGIRVGDLIEPTHGTGSGHEAHEHESLWSVVGILKPTGTPVDKLVLINIDSFYRIPDHADGIIPGTRTPGLSAVVLMPKGGMHKAMVLGTLNKRTDVQVTSVEREIRRLLGIVGRVDQLFLWVALLVVVIGVMSIMVAIYNTMNERSREIAVLRAIGAGRTWIMAVIVGEATALAAMGALGGIVLGHGLTAAVAPQVQQAAGFSPNAFQLLHSEPLLLLGITLAGALAGLLPAWRAYQTDVASHLSAEA